MDFFTLSFFVNSAILGIGLSMDAFSISLANGLSEPEMKPKKIFIIAAVFAFFQAVMPIIGWICIHTVAEQFAFFNRLIPWIALIILGYIGVNMLSEGFKPCVEGKIPLAKLSYTALLIQGIATSIDALSVGFTISAYTLPMALSCALVISAVTLLICIAGVLLGKQFGTCFANKASLLGGAILIAIGLKIFISGVF